MNDYHVTVSVDGSRTWDIPVAADDEFDAVDSIPGLYMIHDIREEPTR